MKNKYQIDREVIDGLSITLDSKKVKSNCKLLDIDMSTSKVDGDFFSKISKVYDNAFVTTRFGKDLVQFKVEPNLDIDKLNYIDESLFPDEIIMLIIEAHRLAKIRTLNDLLN